MPRLVILSDAARLEGNRGEEHWFREVLPATLAAAQPQTVAVQLRHKEASGRERWHWASWLRELTLNLGQGFVINDRLDIARAVGADGVHLPEAGVSVADARACLAPRAWITRAWHGEPLPSSEPWPDGWVLSPAWAPRKGRPALFEEGLKRAVARAKCQHSTPVYALGGITAENAWQCIRAGAQGVVVLGAARTLAGALTLLDALHVSRR